MTRVTEDLLGCEIASSCQHLSESFHQMVVLDGLLQKLFRIPDGPAGKNALKTKHLSLTSSVVYQSMSNHVREPVIPCRVIQKGRGLIALRPRPLSRITKPSIIESSGLPEAAMRIPLMHTFCACLRRIQAHVQKRMPAAKLRVTRLLASSAQNSSRQLTILRLKHCAASGMSLLHQSEFVRELTASPTENSISC